MSNDTTAWSLTAALRSRGKRNLAVTAESSRYRLALRIHMARQLGGLTLAQVGYLVEQARIRECRAGETVLDTLDAARYHLVVLQGEVEVQRRVPDSGHPVRKHARLRPVNVMGGFALLNAVTRELHAAAVSDCRCLLIDADLADALQAWNEQLGSMKRTDPELWRWASGLRDVSLFSQIPPYRLKAVLRSMSVLQVPAGGALFRAGEPADRYFTLEKGEAEIWCCDPAAGEDICVARLEPGDSFGDWMKLPDGRYTTTVRMATHGRLRVLAKVDFEALVAGALQQEIPVTQARAMLEAGSARLLDCRSGLAMLEPRIPGALGMPLDRLRWDMDELDHGTHYIVCCRNGRLARVAAYLLKQRHFSASVLAGGINAWPCALEWG